MRIVKKFGESGKIEWEPIEIHRPNYAEDPNAWIYSLLLSGEEDHKTFPRWYPEGNPLYVSAKNGIDFADNYFSSPGYLARFSDPNHYRNYNNKQDNYAEDRKAYNEYFKTNYTGEPIVRYGYDDPYIYSAYTPAINVLDMGVNYGNLVRGLYNDYKEAVYWPKETAFLTASHEASHRAHETSKGPEKFTPEELELMSKAQPAELRSLLQVEDWDDFSWSHRPFNYYVNLAILNNKYLYMDLDTPDDDAPITQNYVEPYYVDPKKWMLFDRKFWNEVVLGDQELIEKDTESTYNLHDSEPEELDAMRMELLAGLASEGIYDPRFTKEDGTFNPVTLELLDRYMKTKSYQAFPRLINMYRNNKQALLDLLNMTYK